MVQAGMYEIYVIGRHADAMPRQYLCGDRWEKTKSLPLPEVKGVENAGHETRVNLS